LQYSSNPTDIIFSQSC